MSLGLLRIEVRRSAALFLLPLLLAAAWWLAWNGTYGVMNEATFSNVYIWEETSRVVKDSVLNLGPLVAGLSAWAAGRNRRRGIGELLSTTSRSSVFRDLATWGGTALPSAAVYVLLGVLLGVPTALNATWGAPLVGYLLVGLVALLMDSAIGFAAGHHLPSRFTAPLVAVALFVAHLLPMGAMGYGPNLTLLSPAAYSNVAFTNVFYEPAHLAVPQLLLFGGLGTAALCSLALGHPCDRRKARGALGAALVVAAFGFVVALRTENPHGIHAGGPEVAPFESVCEEGRITVCVHPAYENSLPATAEAVREVAKPLLGVPGAPTHAVQADGPRTVPDEMRAEDLALFYDVDAGADGGEEMVKWSAAYGLVGDDAMSSVGMPAKATQEDWRRCGKARDKRAFNPAEEAKIVVGSWLLKRDGSYSGDPFSRNCSNKDELVEGFAALTLNERRAWLEENLSGLRAGKVTLKDLP